MSNLAGGELAARLTPQQRMDMVSKGYSPLNPRDVQAYTKGQRPVDGLAKAAGVGEKRYNKLGMASSNRSAEASYGQELGVDLSVLGDEGTGWNDGETPRTARDIKLGGYGSGFNQSEEAINSRIMSKLGAGNAGMATGIPSINSFDEEMLDEEYNYGPTTHASTKQLIGRKVAKAYITEAVECKKEGYKKGLNYLNAFLENLKNPSLKTRTKLFEAMNNMVLAEDNIHPEMLKEYQHGIALAERALYKDIKAKQK